MGNAVAAALGEQPKKEVRLTVAQKQTLTDLGFGDKELQALKKYFQRLDENRSGIVSLEMFSEKIGIIAQFVERIFDITNGERGGYLPFMDFALSLWNFCTLDDSELPAALFQCYDRDSNGTLSVAELSALSKDLTPEGRTLGPKLRQALKKFDEILEKQEKMRYEHNMAKAKQRLQSAAGGGSHELGAEPELDDPAEIRISPEFLLNFLKQNAALGQPLQQFHVLARQDILGNRTWHNIRQKYVQHFVYHCDFG